MPNISERPLFNDLSVSAGDTILWGSTTPVLDRISSEHICGISTVTSRARYNRWRSLSAEVNDDE